VPEPRTLGCEYFADVWAVGAFIQAACGAETETVRVGPNPPSQGGRVCWGDRRILLRGADNIIERMCPDPEAALRCGRLHPSYSTR